MTATQTIVTPSAKAHERVNCRWIRDLKVTNRRDWAVYFFKSVIGSPVPWLLPAFVICAFFSRAGVEIAAWLSASLTFLYILADRFASTREFKFFRVGCDFFLVGIVLLGIISSITADSPASSVEALGSVRWVLLFYLITYCWELFPGLNRVFNLLVMASLVASLYFVWQHLTGINILDGTSLPSVPVPGKILFIPSGFFGSPEIFGTLVAITLPFPAAAFVFCDHHAGWLKRGFYLVSFGLLVVAASWTYQAGIWVSSLAALLTVMVMVPRALIGRSFKLLLVAICILGALMFESFGSTDMFFTAIENSESLRGDQQRKQINNQVELWESSPWIGTGTKAIASPNYDPKTGNIYFQLLATSGLLGLGCYFLFILGFLLGTYRIFKEIPTTHDWHRVFISAALASQVAFHVNGLYSSTLSEDVAVNLFIVVISAVSYLIEHYSRGLVTDDKSL